MERLFLVPGNHDIDRSVSPGAWSGLRGCAAQLGGLALSRWWAGGDAPFGVSANWREEVLQRQEAYRTWVAKTLGRGVLLPELSGHGRLGYRATVRLPGHPFDVHVIGLDSAWLCGDDHDADKLRLTEDQVMRLAGDRRGDPLPGFRLALMHHLREWSSHGYWFASDGLYQESRGGVLRWQTAPAPAAEATPQTGVFVGRTEEMAALEAGLLAKAPQAVAVTAVQGMPGVGKSYLVRRFWELHANDGSFPGGFVRVFLDPERTPTEAEVRETLVDRLDLQAGGDDAWVCVQERLQRPRTLLHLDNVDSKSAAMLACRLVGRLPGCAVAVCGRWGQLGTESGWTQVRVGILSEDEAIGQLAREHRGLEPARHREREEYRRAALCLGRLPLALHLAAGWLKSGYTVDGFLAELGRQGLDMELAGVPEPLHDEGRARTTIKAAFDLSLEILRAQLGAGAPRLLAGFNTLGHAPPSGVGLGLGSAAAGLAREEWEPLLVQAHRLSLAERSSARPAEMDDPAWCVHPLLAQLMRGRCSEQDVVQRMTEWFLARVPQSAPGEEAAQGKRWGELQRESDALAVWLGLLPSEQAGMVASRARDFAVLCGPYQVWLAWTGRALSATEDPEVRSSLLGLKANVAVQAGAPEEALDAAEEKHRLELKLGRPREAALAIGLRADVLQARGELDEALRIRREEELPVYEKLGDVRSRAVTLGKIADVLEARGELDEALRIRREEELPVYEKLGLKRELLVGRTNLAMLLIRRGSAADREEARTLLDLALKEAVSLRIPEADQIRLIQQRFGS